MGLVGFGATVDVETGFAEERRITLDTFLTEWKLVFATSVVEHAFNPSWPESRMATNKKYQERALIGMVYMALYELGYKVYELIQPGNILKCVSKLAVGVYAFPGHRDSANKSGTQIFPEKCLGLRRGERERAGAASRRRQGLQ